MAGKTKGDGLLAPLTSRVRRAVRAYAALAERRPFVLLGIYIVVAVFAGWLAKTQMEIRTDLESLLPQGSPSVTALDESRQRKGSTDFYTVAVNSPDPEANIRFIKDASARIQQWEETRFVQIDRSTKFFGDHALLYLPKQDLEHLRDKLEKEIKVEKKRLNPLFVDLRTAEEKKAENAERWKMSNWLAPDLAKRLGIEQDLFDQILAADELGLTNDAPKEPADEVELPGEPVGPTVPPHLKHHLISEDGEIAVLLASLTQPATDVVKSKELMERGEAMIAELDPASYHPEMQARVAGAYRNFQEVESISHDSTIATIASSVFVLLVLLSFFRNLRSVVLLIVPLSAGIVYSVGLTAATYGHLNISTLFVFSMLIGMGIDFGIHYYSRILEEYRRGEEMVDAISIATMHAGRAMLSAALTTIAALMTLLLAHFQGFIEFGVIASYGIALCLMAAILVMPPTIFALEKIRKTPRKETGDQPDVLPTTPPTTLKKVRAFAFVLVFIGLGGAILAGYNWDKASFEHDFRNLRGKKTQTGFNYGKAVGKKKNTSPAMILGDSKDQMREVHAELSQRLMADEKGEGYLKSFVTIETYVPPDQDERMAVIEEIHELVTDRKLRRAKGQTRTMLDRMTELSEVEPFTVEEIPDWAQRSIQEQNGEIGRIGFLYSNVRKWDAIDVQNFQNEYGIIHTDTGDVKLASSGFILSDVIRTVKEDASRLMPAIFTVLVLILLIDLRDIKGTLICASTMGVALLWTIGAMIVFDIRLGLYNMIVLPMVLGTGIDGCIHIYHRFKELGPEKIVYIMRTTGLSVVAASLTTLGGFTGLLFVSHKGVESIGTLAVAGIAATLIAILFVLPGVLLATYRPPKAAAAAKAKRT